MRDHTVLEAARLGEKSEGAPGRGYALAYQDADLLPLNGAGKTGYW